MIAKSKDPERWARIWHVPGRDKNSAERHLALLALGLIQALRQGQISVDAVWDSGLNFKTFLRLKESGADRRLLELWTWAMELPQVEKLGDAALSESYEAIEGLANAVLKDRRNRLAGPPKSTSRSPTRFTHKTIARAVKEGRA